jgi:hypothetical protein
LRFPGLMRVLLEATDSLTETKTEFLRPLKMRERKPPEDAGYCDFPRLVPLTKFFAVLPEVVFELSLDATLFLNDLFYLSLPDFLCGDFF